MITRVDNPTFYSSITDVSYESYGRALQAEQMSELVDLKAPLNTVMWTRTAAIAGQVIDHFLLREQQIRMALMMDPKNTQEQCSFTINQSFEHLLNGNGGNDYRLEVLLNMKNNVERGPMLMAQFLQKYYSSLYTAWFSKTDLINPRYGLVGIFARDDGGEMVRYSTPIIHLEKVIFMVERMHKRFLDEYDIIV